MNLLLQEVTPVYSLTHPDIVQRYQISYSDDVDYNAIKTVSCRVTELYSKTQKYGVEVEALLYNPERYTHILNDILESQKLESEMSYMDYTDEQIEAVKLPKEIFTANNNFHSWLDRVSKFFIVGLAALCFMLTSKAIGAQTVLLNGSEYELSEDDQFYLGLYCNMYRIPWKVAESIMMHESGNLTSHAANHKCNLFGLTYKNKVMEFDSRKDCIKAWCIIMDKRYRNCLDLPENEETIRCLGEIGGTIGRYNSVDEEWADKVIRLMQQL